MMRLMERKKTGRPPKPGGPRKRASWDVRLSILAELEAAAKERGMHQVDLVEEALAEKLNLPRPMQEGLPLNKAS